MSPTPNWSAGCCAAPDTPPPAARRRRRHPAQHLRDSRACRGTRARAPERPLRASSTRVPKLRLGLLGCMAQHNRAALVEKAPWLDLVAGPDTLSAAARDARPRRIIRSGQVDVRLDRVRDLRRYRRPRTSAGVRAYVTAMRGCDKFCAFCVVPYVRGRERSVPPEAICARHPRTRRARCHGKSCCSGRRSTPIASATSISAACCAWSRRSTASSESASPRRIPRT